MGSRVLVFTYKDGLLARLAHDLQIHCEQFEIDRRGPEISGRFVLSSLRVDGAVERGRVAVGKLSDGDRSKIEQTMKAEVLEVRRFAEAAFRGTITGTRVEGTLSLHGRTLPLAPIDVRSSGALWVVELVLVPSRWGVTPYRALAGALKLQDRVTVRLELPADADADADAHWR